jgi:hypothetical protein
MMKRYSLILIGALIVAPLPVGFSVAEGERGATVPHYPVPKMPQPDQGPRGGGGPH